MKLHPTTLILAIFAGLVAVGCGSEEPTTNTEVNTPADNTPADNTPADKPADNTPAPAPAEDEPAPQPEEEAVAVDMEGAKAAFLACAACHGNTGEGDGAASAALNPKPRSFSDKEWQASVSDDHLAKVIVEGGAAVGLSPLMAASAHLADQPEVVAGLVKMVRDFGK